jgi:hypothetical protein
VSLVSDREGQGSAVRHASLGNVRSCSSVQQDVSVLEVLRLRAVL